MTKDKVTAYLSRLSGTTVSDDQALKLNSVQTAAFSAWLRAEGVQIGSFELNSPFRVNDLFDIQNRGVVPQTVKEITIPTPPLAVGNSGGGVSGVGIDIEDVKSLPMTSDYRTHEFYKENFSPAEIAYCILQPSAHVSLTGLWAAKEAILKSGAVQTVGRLRDLEIFHDNAGRPQFLGCILCISHTDQTAIAIAIWQGPSTLSAPQADRLSEIAGETNESGVNPRSRGKLVGAGLVIMAVVVSALYWLFLHPRL